MRLSGILALSLSVLFTSGCDCRGVPATLRTLIEHFPIVQPMAFPKSNAPSLSPPLSPQWLRADSLFSALLAS